MSVDAPRVIAVDGGASKTDLVIVTTDGELVAAARGPGSNQHHVGLSGTVDVIRALHARAIADAGPGPRPADAVYVLAGADTPEEERTLEAAIGTHGWSETQRVRNDTYAVLRAGSDRGWGVAVVCGAGINAVGVAPDGREVRFPALGVLSGDWGGGLEVGEAAVGAANRAEDGRGPDTVLRQVVPGHFGLALPSEVATAFHRKQIDSSRLAELPPLVLAAADDGDAVSMAIVDRIAAEVVDLVATSLRRLDLTSADVDVVLGGGLMQAGNDRLDRGIDERINALAPRARIVRPSARPIAGAVLLALDRIGVRGVDEIVRGQFTAADRASLTTDRATEAMGMGAADG